VRDGDRRELPRRRAHVDDQDDGDEEVKKPRAGARSRSRQEEKATAVAGLGMARHWRHPEGEDDMSARGSRCLPLPRWTATARERGGRNRGIGNRGDGRGGESGCAGFFLDIAFCFFLVGGRIAGKETRFRGIFLTFLFFFLFLLQALETMSS